MSLIKANNDWYFLKQNSTLPLGVFLTNDTHVIFSSPSEISCISTLSGMICFTHLSFSAENQNVSRFLFSIYLPLQLLQYVYQMYNLKEKCFFFFSFFLIYEDTVVIVSCLLVSRSYLWTSPELSANILITVHFWSSYFFTGSCLSLFAFLFCVIISQLFYFLKVKRIVMQYKIKYKY